MTPDMQISTADVQNGTMTVSSLFAIRSAEQTSERCVFVGVDPGLNGAIAFKTGDTIHVLDMPTKEVVRNGKRRRHIDAPLLGRVLDIYLGDADVIRAYVEAVGAMPGQGVTSMFTFGRAAGAIDGGLGAHFIEPVYIQPRVWTRALGLPPGADKDAHRALATKLFPALADKLSRKKDEGRADALLLLHFGMTTGAKP